MCKRGKQWPSKAYEVCLVIKGAPESLCAPRGSGMGGCIWWTTQWQLNHASVVSAGTDSGQTPVRKCLEALTSVLSKLSTAKMEKTISLRWEHGEPECKPPLGRVSANMLPQNPHAPLLLCARVNRHCSSMPTCILQAVAHRYARNWFRVLANLADKQQGVRVEVPPFFNVDFEKKWRATECLATTALQLINLHNLTSIGQNWNLPSYKTAGVADGIQFCVSQCTSAPVPPFLG